MRDDLLDFFLVISTLLFTMFLAACLWSATVAPAQCSALGDAMEVKTDYYFWRGCFITMSNGEVVPEEVALKIMQQKYKINVE